MLRPLGSLSSPSTPLRLCLAPFTKSTLGGGYDALALAAPGREVVGLDLSLTAVQSARTLQEERGVSADLCSFVQGDFFTADVVRFPRPLRSCCAQSLPSPGS
jgi:hypothetical protein